MNIFTHFGSFCETSRRFDLSSRSLGHVIFSRETAQEAGVGTLTHRAKEFVTTSEDQECELKHVHNALRTNGYTEWALVVPKQKLKTKPTSTNKGNTRPPSIGLPYVQGLSERLSKTFRQHGVSVYHKPVNTLRSILVHPKDKTPKDKKCGSYTR